MFVWRHDARLHARLVVLMVVLSVSAVKHVLVHVQLYYKKGEEDARRTE